MRFRLFCFLIIGTFLAGILYFTLRFSCALVLQRYVFTEQRKQTLMTQNMDDLQTFIYKNGITAEKLHLINNWAFLHPDVYLMMVSEDGEDFTFYGSNTVFRNVFGQNTQTPQDLQKKMRETEPTEFRLSDGTELKIVMEDTSETVAANAVNFVSLMAAALSLAATVFIYYHRLSKRIFRIAGDVEKVAQGEMQHPVRGDGVGDEVSLLAENVENMRSSLLENLESEREARNSNGELITSLSHDIRTPLTVLLGYLDVMKQQTDDPVMQNYLKSTENTALRLKGLSDDLFRYFLVFGNRDLDLNVRNYHAGTLMDQMITEHTVLMEEDGFTVEVKADEALLRPDVTVAVDAPHLMRILDNLFSNVKKYADKKTPISISETLGDGCVTLTFSNKIRRQNVPSESNRIGLKTCRNIASAMKINFEVQNDGVHYQTRLELPLGGAESEEDAEDDSLSPVE